MRNHIVKQCQASEGADNNAGNCVQCARGQDGTSWTLQTIVGDRILKVSDGKVTHHFHQKGAFGLNGEVSFTRKGR